MMKVTTEDWTKIQKIVDVLLDTDASWADFQVMTGVSFDKTETGFTLEVEK